MSPCETGIFFFVAFAEVWATLCVSDRAHVIFSASRHREHSTAACELTGKSRELHHSRDSVFPTSPRKFWLSGTIKKSAIYCIYMITPDFSIRCSAAFRGLMCLESTVCSTSQSAGSSCSGESAGRLKGKFQKAPTLVSGMQHGDTRVRLRRVYGGRWRTMMRPEPVPCFMDAT